MSVGEISTSFLLLKSSIRSSLSAHYSWGSPVRYQRGLTGPKFSARFNNEPLEFEWPRVLRKGRYKLTIKSLEDGRNQALKQLNAGNPIELGTITRLLADVDELKEGINKELGRQKRNGYRKAEPYFQARRHVDFVSQAVERFVNAQKRSDVKVEEFKEGNIEQLIALMYRNNLRFAESAANGQPAYYAIFQEMVTYYIDMQMASTMLAEAKSEAETNALKEILFNLLVAARHGGQVAGIPDELEQFAMEIEKWNKLKKPPPDKDDEDDCETCGTL